MGSTGVCVCEERENKRTIRGQGREGWAHTWTRPDGEDTKLRPSGAIQHSMNEHTHFRVLHIVNILWAQQTRAHRVEREKGQIRLTCDTWFAQTEHKL